VVVGSDDRHVWRSASQGTGCGPTRPADRSAPLLVLENLRLGHPDRRGDRGMDGRLYAGARSAPCSVSRHGKTDPVSPSFAGNVRMGDEVKPLVAVGSDDGTLRISTHRAARRSGLSGGRSVIASPWCIQAPVVRAAPRSWSASMEGSVFSLNAGPETSCGNVHRRTGRGHADALPRSRLQLRRHLVGTEDGSLLRLAAATEAVVGHRPGGADPLSARVRSQALRVDIPRPESPGGLHVSGPLVLRPAQVSQGSPCSPRRGCTRARRHGRSGLGALVKFTFSACWPQFHPDARNRSTPRMDARDEQCRADEAQVVRVPGCRRLDLAAVAGIVYVAAGQVVSVPTQCSTPCSELWYGATGVQNVLACRCGRRGVPGSGDEKLYAFGFLLRLMLAAVDGQTTGYRCVLPRPLLAVWSTSGRATGGSTRSPHRAPTVRRAGPARREGRVQFTCRCRRHRLRRVDGREAVLVLEPVRTAVDRSAR
jgi:hypothetical protein